MTSLVCPACRESAPPQPLASVPGHLRCARCDAVYPVAVAPIVAHPLAPFVRALQPDLAAPSPAAARALVPFLADDDPLARRLQRVSVAARSHFGDRLSPRQPAAWSTFAPFLELLPGGEVVELGCGAGRVTLELANAKRSVVAIDSDPAVLALATSVVERGEAEVLLRRVGADYAPARIVAPELQGRPVTFALADALNPPLPAESFDAVVALNLLDNVRVPSTLVGQVDALLKPGGLALFSTPYAWDSAHTDDGERLGGAPGRPFGGRPEDELRRLLSGAGQLPWSFEIVREDERVPWTLVRDERCRFQYELHVVVARKR